MVAALETVDALVSPAAPTPAYPLGAKLNDPLAMYAGDLMTVNVNLAGLPAIVVRKSPNPKTLFWRKPCTAHRRTDASGQYK